MRNVAKSVFVGLLFVACGLLVWKVVLPALQPGGDRGTPPPAIGTESGLSAKELRDLASASDLEAPSHILVDVNEAKENLVFKPQKKDEKAS